MVGFTHASYVKASEKTGATLLTADDLLCEKGSKIVPTLHLETSESMYPAGARELLRAIFPDFCGSLSR
jgi:hypothetical protein